MMNMKDVQKIIVSEISRVKESLQEISRAAVIKEVGLRREIQNLTSQTIQLGENISQKNLEIEKLKLSQVKPKMVKLGFSKFPIIRIIAFDESEFTDDLPGGILEEAISDFQRCEEEQRILRDEYLCKIKDAAVNADKQLLDFRVENSRLNQMIYSLKVEKESIIKRNLIDLAIKIGAEIPFMLRDAIGFGSYPALFEFFRSRRRPEFIEVVNGTRDLRRKLCHPSFDEKYKSMKWNQLICLIKEHYPNSDSKKGLVELCEFVQKNLKFQTPFQG